MSAVSLVAADDLRSAEYLPNDRFDEYPEGQFPPPPWEPVGEQSQSVVVQLSADAESALMGNYYTGKGVRMSDRTTEAGEGIGFGQSFIAAPEGDIYLGFDFRLGNSEGKGSGLPLAVYLKNGKHTVALIQASTPGGIFVVDSKGDKYDIYKNIQGGTWYHLGVTFRTTGKAEYSLFTPDNLNDPMWTGTSDFTLQQPITRLECVNGAGNKAEGVWALDNIVVGGQVFTDRSAWLPFKQLPLPELANTPKKVFCYYYPIYSSGWSKSDPGLGYYQRSALNAAVKEDSRRKDAGTKFFYFPLVRPPMDQDVPDDEVLLKRAEEEIRLAKQMGLDGFVVDFFYDTSKGSGLDAFNNVSFALVDAAPRVDPDFKIIPSVYTQSASHKIGGADEKVDFDAYVNSEVYQRLYDSPAVYRTEDGRMLFTMWFPERHTAGFWQRVIQAFEAKGWKVAFMTEFNTKTFIEEFGPFTEVMANWGPRTPIDFEWVELARPHSPIVAAPIASHDIRSRGPMYWESANYATLLKTWETAINENADWAIINTWSDYSEQAMAPSSAIGFSLHDINTYFTQWFKTGEQPEITQDVLYFSYRIHHRDSEPRYGRKWSLVRRSEKEIALSSGNEIELLAFMTEPGELVIRMGDETHTKQVDAGIQSFRVEMPEGQTFMPEFALVRNGETVVSGRGNHAVLDQIEFPNMLYHSGVIAQ